MAELEPDPAAAPDTTPQAAGASVQVAGTGIEGLALTPLVAHRDHRGDFTEVYADQWGLPVQPSQWSLVRSGARVLRGMHLHLRHTEYVSVIAGRMLLGLRDLRPDSPTSGNWTLHHLDADAPACLSWPEGVLHGWYSLTPSTHLQAVSESYVDYALDDNLRVRWDDPELGIPWPDPDPVISELAAGAGSLRQCLARVAAGPGSA